MREFIEEGGFNSLLEPMLAIEPAGFFVVPDMERFQALVFTSVQAVRVFCEACDFRGVKVFTVGGRTALEAREHGFDDVLDAKGTSEELLSLIFEHIVDVSKPFLHVRGEHIASPLDEVLAEHDIKLESLIVYSAKKAEKFQDGFFFAGC